MPFKIGDVVALKSDGRVMEIIGISPNGRLWCHWNPKGGIAVYGYKNEPEEGSFKPEELRLHEPLKIGDTVTHTKQEHDSSPQTVVGITPDGKLVWLQESAHATPRTVQTCEVTRTNIDPHDRSDLAVVYADWLEDRGCPKEWTDQLRLFGK